MNYFFLTRTELFYGLREDELESILICLKAYERNYKSKDVIYRAGTSVKEIGLVEYGSIHIVDYDYTGNRSILGNIKAGDVFALAYAAIPGKHLTDDVVANEDCQILFLNVGRLLTTCHKNCPYHARIIHNLFTISAKKMLNFHQRMRHMSGKTIRDKLISFLSEQAFEHASPHFTITFNRQQLADYLNIDRSALSNELSKMQKEGLIAYEKNTFTIKNINY